MNFLGAGFPDSVPGAPPKSERLEDGDRRGTCPTLAGAVLATETTMAAYLYYNGVVGWERPKAKGFRGKWPDSQTSKHSTRKPKLKWGARPSRVHFSASSRKTPDAQQSFRVSELIRTPNGWIRGRIQQRPGRACSPTSVFGFNTQSRNGTRRQDVCATMGRLFDALLACERGSFL
jgi:hypothetical protein